MKIIAGLGNPGPRYTDTRHNIGFLAVDRIAQDAGIRIRQQKYQAEVGIGAWEGQQVLLMKPQTYMNKSGESVKSAIVGSGSTAADLIVIHDDIDLEPGSIRIKVRGGHGGHNGIRSLIALLGTDEFARVKIGVGRPGKEVDTAGYVLEPFARGEKPVMEEALVRVVDAVRMIRRGDIALAMNRFHTL